MDLEIRHLKLVEAVATEGSVTRAAARLNLTQSALSHQLRDIENRLETPLFRRTARRMTLTTAGEKVFECARRVLGEIENVEDAVRGGAHTRGRLRVTTECYTCYYWLPRQLREFRRRYPHVEVSINAKASSSPIEAVANGEVDIAIVSDPVGGKRVETTPLFADELLLVMAPDHRLAGKRYVTAKHLEQEHLILYCCDISQLTLYQEVLIPAGVRPLSLTGVELTEAILELVKAGMGVSAMARWAIRPAIESGQVKVTRITPKGLRRHWQAATLKSRSTPLYMREFVDLLRREGELSLAEASVA
jgi:LysR family transcriptional regulator for metE and metH